MVVVDEKCTGPSKLRNVKVCVIHVLCVCFVCVVCSVLWGGFRALSCVCMRVRAVWVGGWGCFRVRPTRSHNLLAAPQACHRPSPRCFQTLMDWSGADSSWRPPGIDGTPAGQWLILSPLNVPTKSADSDVLGTYGRPGRQAS